MSIINQAWLDAHPDATKKKRSLKGYASPPGTGPKGETCGSCVNHVVKQMAGTYHKCWLMHKHWTGGSGTDILVRSPACGHWESGKED